MRVTSNRELGPLLARKLIALVAGFLLVLWRRSRVWTLGFPTS